MQAPAENEPTTEEQPKAKASKRAESKAAEKPKSKATASRAKTSLKDRLANKMKTMSKAPAAEAPEDKSADKAKNDANRKPKVTKSTPDPVADEPLKVSESESAPKVADSVKHDGGTRLFINLGRKDGYNAQHLRDLVAELGGLLPEDIFNTSIRPRFSFLIVDDKYADDLIEAINGERVKGRLIRIEKARDDG